MHLIKPIITLTALLVSVNALPTASNPLLEPGLHQLEARQDPLVGTCTVDPNVCLIPFENSTLTVTCGLRFVFGGPIQIDESRRCKADGNVCVT